MQFKISLMSLLFVCSTLTALAQERASAAKELFVEVPREVGLVTVAYQPNCPLQFENVKWLAGVEGGAIFSYNLRNKGTKPIRTIKIGNSAGSIWSWDVASEHGPIMPGQLIPDWSKDDYRQVVPLTNELRKKLKLEGPMKGKAIVIVIRVEFMDGTVYDDEAVYTALMSHLEDLDHKQDRLEYLERQQKATKQ